MKQKLIYILLGIVVLCSGCEWKLRPNEDADESGHIIIQRYDRLESRYLTTGDFSALQQMNTEYPIETRTLVEKMLQIGDVSDHDISERFLRFYQDSLLQTLVADAESEYANMDDITQQFNKSFEQLREWIPDLPIPKVYTQIGALDQSIVIGENSIGISLDKYMGAKYPLYGRFGFSQEQLQTMGRSYIVPDAISFYLLSLHPLDNYDRHSQFDRDIHVGKVMWIVNKVMKHSYFESDAINYVDRFMKTHPQVTIRQLLEAETITELK